nr:universal stress protein [Sphingomonas lycopersici]
MQLTFPPTRLQRAQSLASLNCAELDLVHVDARRDDETDRARAAGNLKAIADAEASTSPCIAHVRTHLATGDPAPCIAEIAERHDVDLILLGAHHKAGWKEHLLPTVAEQLLRLTHRPVLVVRRPSDAPYHRLLVAVADGVLAQSTLDLALAVTSLDEIVAVHAFVPDLRNRILAGGDVSRIWRDQQEALESTLQGFAARNPQLRFSTNAIAVVGDTGDVLRQAEQDFSPDLTVIVTHALRGLARALHGSIADTLIEAGEHDLLLQATAAD